MIASPMRSAAATLQFARLRHPASRGSHGQRRIEPYRKSLQLRDAADDLVAAPWMGSGDDRAGPDVGHVLVDRHRPRCARDRYRLFRPQLPYHPLSWRPPFLLTLSLAGILLLKRSDPGYHTNRLFVCAAPC